MIFMSAKDAKGREEDPKGFTSPFFASFADKKGFQA